MIENPANQLFDDAPKIDNSLIASGTDHREIYKPGLSFTNANPYSGDDPALFEKGLTTFEAYTEILEGAEEMDAQLVALGAAGVALDVMSAATDPIAFFSGQIASWMLEHLDPARKALEALTGNPEMIKAYAASWYNIGEHMESVVSDLGAAVRKEISEWEGLAGTAYRAYVATQVGVSAGLAAGAHTLSELTRMMGEVVNGVRTAVRDILSGLVGSLVSWTLELAFSIGTATPVVIAQATTKIASVVAKVSSLLLQLSKYIGGVLPLLTATRDILDGLYRALPAPGRHAELGAV